MLLEWSQEAIDELNEAVAWYKTQSPEQVDRFLVEITHAEALIASQPHAWNPVTKHVRSLRLDRFPYSLVYTLLPIPVVFVFMHQSRKPLYWKKRLH